MQPDGELHGFWNSRRGGVQQVPDPDAERVLRMEQELRELREALLNRRIPGQDFLGTYGAQPFRPVGPPTVHSANPQQTQWHLNQACNDVNLRDWVRVNDVHGGPSNYAMPPTPAGQQPCDRGGSGLHGGNPGGLPGGDPWGMGTVPGQQPGQGNMMNPGGGGGHDHPHCGGHGNAWMGGMPHGGRQPGGNQDDDLKAVNITLPKLPEIGSKNAGLEAGDRLAHIRPQIADVSSRAMVWWDELMRVTMERYHQWLEGDPMQRLGIQPPALTDLPQGFLRLDQRVTSLLLPALPKSVATEMVANRQLNTPQIIFRVLKVYQPGGLAERQSTLSALTTTQVAASWTEASLLLRQWK
eukprot:s2557_g3.t1